MRASIDQLRTWIRFVAIPLVVMVAVSGHAHPLAHPTMPVLAPNEGLLLAGIVGRDDRRLSLFPFVANIGVGHQSLASAVVIGRRHLITAAHLFVMGGHWRATGSDRKPVGSEYNHYRVYIEGCPNQLHGVSDVFLNTLNPEANHSLDYAVVQLKEPHCGVSAPIWSMSDDQVEQVLLHANDGPEAKMVTAVGYYGPHTVGRFEQSAQLDTGVFHDLEFDMSLAWQYAAEGPVVGQDARPIIQMDDDNPQRLLVHKIDVAVGSSGGPLLIRDGDEVYVIGIQVGERHDAIELNYAVRISDGFLDLIVEHVPDVVVK